MITSHLNADFDALASSGSQERDLRDFLLQSSSYFIDVKRLKDVDLDKVKLLVVVDTRQKSRIGSLALLLERPDVEVHVFDHHPPSSGDIKAAKTVFRPVGANTTLMIRLLREKGLDISPDEATFLALGIYEDTGSFTFSSTTSEDLEAAAWLLGKGADLKTISELLGHRFTPEHVELLNDLLSTAATYTLAGIPVTLAKTSSPVYVEDFAVLAHELMDMEKLPVIFAMALMADQILIVGRSRDERVDVGKVLKAIGGGGHPMAASATIKGLTLAEAEERLFTELHGQLGTEPKVKDIMSYPVLSVLPDTKLSQVKDKLTRYGITVLPIVHKGKVLGLISRRTVEKAIYHGLSNLPVREYMTTDFEVICPEDTLAKVQELIVNRRQRFVPVVDKGQVEGVITRTDLLQILSGDAARRPEALLSGKEQRKNVLSLLRERLPSHILDLLMNAGEVAEGEGFHICVAGGFVRDLLLRKPNLDIDLVVEGDGIAFAEVFAKRFRARVRAHQKFGTAVVIFPDGFKVDVATARWEYYEYPAAMPTVALSSTKLDLFRRDFTINTLAIKLNPKEFGLLIDFFGGQRDLKDHIIQVLHSLSFRDLKDHIIQVLHSLSFVEDPTRVFRAVRFEQRYGFRIGKHTLRLIRNAVRLDIFSRLSGKRLLAELILILKEPDPRSAIKRLAGLDLLKVIHQSIRLGPKEEGVLARSYDVLAWYDLLFRPLRSKKWMVYLLTLVKGLKFQEIQEVVDRLGLVGSKRNIFVEGHKVAIKALDLLSRRSFMKASEVYWLLKGLDINLLLHILSITENEDARQAISRYITELCNASPLLTGDDLKDMGLEPGPLFRTILHRLLEARLDGEIRYREDEIQLVKREFLDRLGN
ncbi:MAG: CBS domain-containing protein [Deltaproteobacteria bacterium]|nr:CBS domain-containing protein [Deltaproteobacteria bacterium]